MFLSGLLNILNCRNRVSCNMQIRLVVLSNAHVPQPTVFFTCCYIYRMIQKFGLCGLGETMMQTTN